MCRCESYGRKQVYEADAEDRTTTYVKTEVRHEYAVNPRKVFPAIKMLHFMNKVFLKEWIQRENAQKILLRIVSHWSKPTLRLMNNEL